ncbi:HTH-type transcriptional repressor PurR [Pantoea ananatis AJ13355]|uniref:HTH-type transcriptional repressor PurR n=1 Tax=Pantoea ananatis (strain AJ13355) TaxID=932677 RepID=A0A0H3L2Y4_PANAA|nr:HTH-type transcriptional repressor PurR [Pantoea ananatis AJ13355]
MLESPLCCATARNIGCVSTLFNRYFLPRCPITGQKNVFFCRNNRPLTQTFNNMLINRLDKPGSSIFMATIKDVAKRAGVSTTTVSHVINKTRFVAEDTREAVWEAIRELHYSPSAVARSLKVNHTKTLGLLATSSEAPYFAEIIEAVENHCFDKGYTLILGNAHNDLQKQRAYLSMMAQKRVDGLLVMCSEYPDDLLQMLEANRNIPMVVMDWGESRADFTDTVLDNAFQGGYLAGRLPHRTRASRYWRHSRANGTVTPVVAVMPVSSRRWKKPEFSRVQSGLCRAISSLNPGIRLCSKFCRRSSAQARCSAVAILWPWALSVPPMKWACASRRIFR